MEDKIQLGNDDIRKYSWATTIEKEVGRLNGVNKISVDYDKKIVIINYDEKLVNRTSIDSKIDEVIKRFKNKGFLQ